MEIHHIGIVVRSVEEHYEKHMAHFFGDDRKSEIIHDPLQKVNALFIQAEGGRIELLEPAAEDSPIRSIAEKAPAGYHHVCLLVHDLDEQLRACRASRQAIVSPPTPAIAFDNRRIAFVMGRDRLLWELLERRSIGDTPEPAGDPQ